MTHASLFSGIGGPEVAAAMLGWDNLFHCEINPFGRNVLDYWFPDSVSYEDITKTDFHAWRGKVDVLTGGFPCQPFSYAGKRGGREDERYLWPEMLRAIDEVRPTWVVGENVAGLATMVEGGVLTDMGGNPSLFDEGDDVHGYLLRQSFTIERICTDLERLGYSVQPVLVPAAAVGAPHRRDRIFIIAHSDVSRAESLRSGRENTIHRFESSSDPDGRRSREIPTQIYAGVADGDISLCDGSKQDASNPSNIGCWCSFDTRTEEEVCREMERERDRSFGNIPITTNGIRRAATDTHSPGLQAERPSKQAAGNRGGCEEDAANSDCERRQESLKSRRGEDSEEEGAGMDDRTERFGSNGDVANSKEQQYARVGHDERTGSKREERQTGRSISLSVARLCPENKWQYDEKGNWMPTVSPVHRGNDGIPFDVDSLAVPPMPDPPTYGKGDPKKYPFGKWRTESLKAYGNAIVPQVMYRIFQAIESAATECAIYE